MGKISKKGQISVFIIFLVLLVFIILFTLPDRNISQSSTMHFSGENIQSYVENCLKKVAEEGVFITGLSGGLHAVNEPFIDFIVPVPFYFNNGEDNSPDLEYMQYGLGSYIEENLHACLKNFSDFTSQGYNIEGESLLVKAYFGHEVIIELTYPLKITYTNQTMALSKFSSKLDFDFNKIFQVIEKFKEEQNKQPNSVPIGFMAYLSKTENIMHDIYFVGDNRVLYEFVFPEHDNYALLFGGKYNWSYMEVGGNG